jgi:putative oxidoreductase
MDHLTQSFDLTNGWNILRIACGAFFVPHLVAKFSEREFVVAFFEKVGFRPALFWVYVALGVEVLAAVGLILAIFTFYAAVLAAAFLSVAALATFRFSSGRWLWNAGGCEYPLFWAIACIVVAVQAWPGQIT